jgi:outer membrane biosynthesis protein TonB
MATKAAPKTTATKPAVKKVAAKPAPKAAPKAAAKPAPKTVAKPAPKVVAKPAPKTAAAKPAPKAAPKTVAKPKVAAKPAAPEVKAKLPKEKLVRDSFTMPEAEYAVLGQVKKTALKAGFEVKKSELLRVGVALIAQIDLATLKKVLASLPQLKTGRPKKA